MLFDFVSVSIALRSCARGFTPHLPPYSQKTSTAPESVI